ncbi:FRG domain-containing protein [Streptomyces phaeochromogenes]|uniref:FRG domain-containing protein n=1 Tax=Streptomyces phaeochromogenes TaxID=1923 RepID=UPI003409446F
MSESGDRGCPSGRRAVGKDKGVYRSPTLTHWKKLEAEHDLCGMKDLSDFECPFDEEHADPVVKVTSFLKLFKKVSFLSVMNKRWTLLFRGQELQAPLKPRLFRTHWKPPDDDAASVASLEGDERRYFWESLPLVEELALGVVKKHGLPRWRHFDSRALPRWAIVQHYELWPTPLLDFSTSLRVAASFALGVRPTPRKGYVYVVCVPRVRGDMDLEDADAEERARKVLAVRLNSVCPPSALRSHLQEGVMVSRYPVMDDLSHSADHQDLSSLVIATFKLVDKKGEFWDKVHFPRHSQESLLPSLEQDPLLRDLREAVRYRPDPSGRIHVVKPT